MKFSTKQLEWLKIAKAQDLMKIRPRLTNEEYKETEKMWLELKQEDREVAKRLGQLNKLF